MLRADVPQKCRGEVQPCPALLLPSQLQAGASWAPRVRMNRRDADGSDPKGSGAASLPWAPLLAFPGSWVCILDESPAQ